MPNYCLAQEKSKLLPSIADRASLKIGKSNRWSTGWLLLLMHHFNSTKQSQLLPDYDAAFATQLIIYSYFFSLGPNKQRNYLGNPFIERLQL